MSPSIADIRKDYRLHSLHEKDVLPHPVDQFSKWWDEAVHSDVQEVNAMTLATATTEGIPSARIVLLKGFDKDGFVFFTNYLSQKAQDLVYNPHASLVFFWKELERQVRISGQVEKTSEEESDTYFQSRPAGSRIGAWASPQSEVIAERDVLENSYADLEKKFADGDIPRPGFWGGYRLRATMLEFWQGRSSRLHDRIRYSMQPDGDWKIERLAP